MTISVFRPSRTKNGKRVKSRIYLPVLSHAVDAKGKIRFASNLGQASSRKRRHGNLSRNWSASAADSSPRKPSASRPTKSLELHLDNFASDLRAQGRDRMYVYNVEMRLAKLCKECGWKVIGDMTPDSFQAWRATQDPAAKTLKDYLDAAMGFVKWLMANGRCTANPLASVAKVQTRGEAGPQAPRSHVRRIESAAGGGRAAPCRIPGGVLHRVKARRVESIAVGETFI